MRNFAQRQLWKESDPHGSGEWWADPRHRGTPGAEHLRARRRSIVRSRFTDEAIFGDVSFWQPKKHTLNRKKTSKICGLHTLNRMCWVFFLWSFWWFAQNPRKIWGYGEIKQPKIGQWLSRRLNARTNCAYPIVPIPMGLLQLRMSDLLQIAIFYLVSGLCTWSY